MTLRALADAVRALSSVDGEPGFYNIDRREVLRLIEQAAASEGLDVERFVWAEHLVTEHGALGSATATPCFHRRGSVGNPGLVDAILTEYSRLAATPSHPATSETVECRHEWELVHGVPWAVDREGSRCRLCGRYEGESP